MWLINVLIGIVMFFMATLYVTYVAVSFVAIVIFVAAWIAIISLIGVCIFLYGLIFK